MVTKSGVLVHIDFCYFLGEEPLTPATLVSQAGSEPLRVDYNEIAAAIGRHNLDEIFWPLLTRSYNALRKHAALLVVLLEHADSAHGVQRTEYVSAFVRSRCMPGMLDVEASRFIESVVLHSKDSSSVWLRDFLQEAKNLTRELTQTATESTLPRAYGAALSIGQFAANSAWSTGRRAIRSLSIAADAAVGPRDARENRSDCAICGTGFSFFSWQTRHHCRVCSRSVCDKHFKRPFCVRCIQPPSRAPEADSSERVLQLDT